MNYSVCWKFLLALVIALAITGCSSPASQVARGMARLGDTPAMVERRMGPPDEKQDRPNLPGNQSVWYYKNYIQSSGRPEQTGWSEVLVPAVQDHNGHVVQKAVTRDINHKQASEDIRVTFKDGVVSLIEDRK